MAAGSVLDATWFRMAVSAAVGVGVAMVVGLGLGLVGPLAGWIAFAAVFSAWTWLRIRGLDCDEVRTHAQAEDPGRALGDVVLLLASVAAVVGVGFLLLASSVPAERPRDALVGVLGVVASWVLVHMVNVLRYAREHVADPKHGVDFGGTDSTYVDFAYLSYTIGMTYQVSDTEFQSTAMRRLALGHALLSYFLGAVVIACTINLVVQLARSG